jgi:glycosyltransferase involved in cell wall biosynthesis
MGIPEERIAIVSNTPDLKKFEPCPKRHPGIMSKLKNDTVFLYIGYIDFYRGLQVAVQGFQGVVKEHPDAKMVVVGSGGAFDYNRALVEKLGLSEHVFFEGYQNHSLIKEYIASCDIGIIPHYACGLWNNTIPNKLFDYMAMNKPVLSSDAVPVQRIVEDENCGLIYESRSPSGFADVALRLMEFDMRQSMGANGRSAIERRYNWKYEETEMLRQIESLI